MILVTKNILLATFLYRTSAVLHLHSHFLLPAFFLYLKCLFISLIGCLNSPLLSFSKTSLGSLTVHLRSPTGYYKKKYNSFSKRQLGLANKIRFSLCYRVVEIKMFCDFKKHSNVSLEWHLNRTLRVQQNENFSKRIYRLNKAT